MDQTEKPISEESLDVILKRYGMRTVRVGATLAESGETFNVSIVVPDRTPATHWSERFLALLWLERGDMAMHRRASRLRRLQQAAAGSGLRYGRHLNYLDLRRSSWFRESKNLLGPDLSLEALVRKLGQESDLSDEDLLTRALYPLDLPDLPADEDEYMSFSTCILEGLEGIFGDLSSKEMIDKMETEFPKNPQVKDLLDQAPHLVREKSELEAFLESGRACDEERKKAKNRLRLLEKALGILELTGDPARPIGWQGVLDRAWPRVVMKVLDEAVVTEGRDGSRLQEMGRRAEAILNQIVERPHPDTAPPTIVADAIDGLLKDTISFLRSDAIGDTSWSESYVAMLEEVRAQNDVVANINAAIDIWRQFRDRGAMVQYLLREADLVLPYCIGEAARELYRRVRQRLSRAERRLFALMWLPRLPRLGTEGPTLPFGGQVLMTLPLIGLLLDDGELVALSISVLGFKQGKTNGEDDGKALRSIYRKHLAFYAWCAQISRDEDQERKHQRRNLEVQPPDDKFLDQVQDQTPAKFDFESPLEEVVLPTRQRQVARMYLIEGMTQEEIAGELNVSQQAVSKLLGKIEKQLQTVLRSQNRNGDTGFRFRSLFGRGTNRSRR
jgi:RNA polymerase sigma factor (sigma-70 family)